MSRSAAKAVFVALLVFSVTLAVSAQSIDELKKQAGAGDAKAQLNLGFAYNFGKDVPKDYIEAVHWYRKAAEQGLATAQFELGVMYANGEGVPKDEAEAVRWFRKAAEQGDADAQSSLGFAYDNGAGLLLFFCAACCPLQGQIAQLHSGHEHDIDSRKPRRYYIGFPHAQKRETVHSR